MEDLVSYYRGKRVLVTGHTGFKGSWLCWVLADMGAQVAGYALEPPTEPALFNLAGVSARMESYIGDIRDFDRLRAVFANVRPEVVFHLAAQPIVRDSYDDPRRTFEINVMGTVNVLECVRCEGGVESVLNVTTDKVYLNEERTDYAFTEDDPLDGFDPYSNSKSCSELVTHSYARSFFTECKVPVSTARAGNVIGGGDFAAHRIVPDCVRAALNGQAVVLRNPHSVRPFQHVLEPLMAYMQIAAAQARDASKAGWYNVGPEKSDCVSAGQLADLWCEAWGWGASWVAEENAAEYGKHEAGFLRLDSSKLKRELGWRARWSAREAVARTVEWTRCWLNGKDVGVCMSRQARDYRTNGTYL